MVEKITSVAHDHDNENNSNGKLVFKFFKNQEIPEFFYNLDSDEYMKAPLPKAQTEDYVDFNITLIDNGDEKVCL